MRENKLKPDELQHKGTPGMKWGQRHGPPYPLRPRQVPTSMKKAGWKPGSSVVGLSDIKVTKEDADKAVGLGKRLVKGAAKGAASAMEARRERKAAAKQEKETQKRIKKVMKGKMHIANLSEDEQARLKTALEFDQKIVSLTPKLKDRREKTKTERFVKATTNAALALGSVAALSIAYRQFKNTKNSTHKTQDLAREQFAKVMDEYNNRSKTYDPKKMQQWADLFKNMQALEDIANGDTFKNNGGGGKNKNK